MENRVPSWGTVNQSYYKMFLETFLERSQKRPQLWENGFLHEEYRPTHRVLLVQHLFAYKCMTVHHSPYFLDLEPCDFVLLPEFKLWTQGTWIKSVFGGEEEYNKASETTNRRRPTALLWSDLGKTRMSSVAIPNWYSQKPVHWKEKN